MLLPSVKEKGRREYLSSKHYVGLNLTGFEDNGVMRPVSRITLLVDSDHVITAGDDSGLELTADCPHATQAMADAILARLKGYKYQMYTADAASIDPAAELGDGVTAGGIYSVISRINDDGDGYPSLEAPGEEETQDEFPTAGEVTKTFNRQIADTRATITKTAESITLEVAKKVGYDEVISSINQTAEQITINASKISLEGAVSINKTFQIDTQGYLQCTGGKIGGFSIGTSSLYNGLSSFSGTTNGVYIGTDGIALGGGKFKVDSSGNLTASSGTFTGKVRANQIQVGGDNGYITGSQIGSSTISGGNIGSQTIGVGNMGTNSIENRCIQSGSIYNSTLSGGCVSNAKLDADLQNVIASAITASRITSGLASATSFSCTSFSFNGYPCYWSRCTSLDDGKYYITRNTY